MTVLSYWNEISGTHDLIVSDPDVSEAMRFVGRVESDKDNSNKTSFIATVMDPFGNVTKQMGGFNDLESAKLAVVRRLVMETEDKIKVQQWIVDGLRNGVRQVPKPFTGSGLAWGKLLNAATKIVEEKVYTPNIFETFGNVHAELYEECFRHSRSTLHGLVKDERDFFLNYLGTINECIVYSDRMTIGFWINLQESLKSVGELAVRCREDCGSVSPAQIDAIEEGILRFLDFSAAVRSTQLTKEAASRFIRSKLKTLPAVKTTKKVYL